MGYHSRVNLKTLYTRLDDPARARLAEVAGITPDYLRQVATGWVRPDRGKPVRLSVPKLRLLCVADKRLKLHELIAEFYGAEDGPRADTATEAA